HKTTERYFLRGLVGQDEPVPLDRQPPAAQRSSERSGGAVEVVALSALPGSRAPVPLPVAARSRLWHQADAAVLALVVVVQIPLLPSAGSPVADLRVVDNQGPLWRLADNPDGFVLRP